MHVQYMLKFLDLGLFYFTEREKELYHLLPLTEDIYLLQNYFVGWKGN